MTSLTLQQLLSRLALSPTLLGLILFLIGKLLSVRPPKKINQYSGYRTRLSMLNQETWDEANRYSALVLVRTGAACFVVGLLAAFFISSILALSTITGAAGIISAVAVLILTERRLRALFDHNGHRK